MSVAAVKQLEDIALQEIRQAPAPEALELLRVKYLGRKGDLTLILRGSEGPGPGIAAPGGPGGQSGQRGAGSGPGRGLEPAEGRRPPGRRRGHRRHPAGAPPAFGTPAPHHPHHAGDLRHLPAPGLRDGGRPRGGAGLVQLRGPQPAPGPPGPGHAGHLLLQRPGAAAHPHLAHADPHHGAAPAAGAHHRPGAGLPPGLGPDPYPHVPPGGGPAGG